MNGELPSPKGLIEQVRRGMRLAVSGGTARALSDASLRAAGQ